MGKELFSFQDLKYQRELFRFLYMCLDYIPKLSGFGVTQTTKELIIRDKVLKLVESIQYFILVISSSNPDVLEELDNLKEKFNEMFFFFDNENAFHDIVNFEKHENKHLKLQNEINNYLLEISKNLEV